MSEYANDGFELGWDAEIENEGQDFVVAEDGDYDFTVTGFERTRFGGSSKMPPCNQAKVSIKLDMPNGENCVIVHNLFLHSKTEWRLCEFFTGIGQRKHGQKVAMNWNAVPNARGRCHVIKRSFTGKDGAPREANDITKFYDPAECGSDLPFTYSQQAPAQPQQPPQQAYVAPPQQYQQPPQYTPQYATPPAQQPPQYQQAPQAPAGYVPGKF